MQVKDKIDHAINTLLPVAERGHASSRRPLACAGAAHRALRLCLDGKVFTCKLYALFMGIKPYKFLDE